MLLSDADILYDADGVSRFDGTDNQPTDQNEDTSQDQPPEERDDDLVSTPDQPDDDPSEAPSDSAGRTNIGDLLDITGPGGGSGGQTHLPVSPSYTCTTCSPTLKNIITCACAQLRLAV